MTIKNKAELRIALRNQRRNFSAQQQQQAAHSLLESVIELPAWQHATSIALYLAFEGEISTAAIAQHAREAKKEIFLPVIDEQNRLEFARWRERDTLEKNRFGIAQPCSDALRCAVDALNIIFLPVVGWDATGTRLGMGGGYYDRALELEANKGSTLYVGLAHTCQQVAEIERERWDVGMDFVATDTALHRC